MKDLLLLFLGVLVVATAFAIAGRVRVAYGAEYRHSTAFYRYQWLEARERINEQRRRPGNCDTRTGDL